MIKICLNNLDYRYEVYLILNVYFPFIRIDFVDSKFDYEIIIKELSIDIRKNGNIKEEYVLDANKYKQSIKRSIFLFFRKETGKKIPWGILTGIRPTKITNSLINQGKNRQEIIAIFEERYFVKKEKTILCYDTVINSREFINANQNKISVYIGMPFCPSRCVYCSFASNAISKKGNLVSEYIEALKREIEEFSKYIKEKALQIDCVYFGGGTPTSIDNNSFSELLETIYKNFVEGHNIREFNIECGRPDSLNDEKFKIMKKYEVSRISINPQSMNDKTLKLIGRNHTVEDIINKYYMARNYGFDNINMDLIIGLPKENISDVINTCNEIIKLNPDNITVHGLALKRASKLHEEMVINNKDGINHEEVWKMYDETYNLSNRLDMIPYYMYRQRNMVGDGENVGYSKEGKEGIYNIQIIEEKQTIIALGADAVTKIVNLENNRIDRVPNIKDVREYIIRLDEKIKEKKEKLDLVYNS